MGEQVGDEGDPVVAVEEEGVLGRSGAGREDRAQAARQLVSVP
jgi:hypothetical protein